MKEYDVEDLLRINEILQRAESVSDDVAEKMRTNYLKTLQKLNASNRHNHIASMAKASQTYIYQSTMGNDYYESLSPEMKCLTDTIGCAFENSAFQQEYDKHIFRRIIISNYEINYAEHSPLQTADIRNVSKGYTTKPANFTFNMYNFLKYLSEIELLAEEIAKRDIVAVIIVALSTIAQLKSDMTKEINENSAYFLRFLYDEIGFGGEKREDDIVEKYLRFQGKDHSKQNVDEVHSIINALNDLKVTELSGGKIRIIEKVII